MAHQGYLRHPTIRNGVIAFICDDDVWRVDASGVHKELAFSPQEAWQEASVAWKNANTVVIEYMRAREASPQIVERRLDDATWVRVRR